jgi:signal transduction histidine kinase
VTVVMIVGYAALPVINVLSGPIGAGALAGLVACMAVQAGVVLRLAADHGPLLPGRLRAGTLAVQLVATALPLLWIDAPWGSMGGFLAGTVLLTKPRRRWAPFLGVGAAVGVLAVIHREPVAWSAYLVISTLLTGLILYGIGSLSSLVAQVDRMRDELARTAVARERSRLARDLDELLGRDLTLLAAECRTAYGHLGHDPTLARAAVAEMLHVCRRALTTVRTAAGGYRYASLAAELDSTASVLAAAGVRLQVEPPGRPVPHALDQALGVAVREAVANVLRHSDARWCRIRIRHSGDDVRLEVTNDGSLTSADPALEPGSGLGELASDIGSLGGRLTARVSPDRTFHLLVDLPVVGGDRVAP